MIACRLQGCQEVEGFWKNDLPEKFHPMAAKELRQSMRRGSFVYPFLGIQILALCAMVAEFQMGANLPNSQSAGMLNLAMFSTAGPFWAVVMGICMLLMPLSGMVLMGQELEEGNHELLLLTKLDRWKIVWGKFITLWGLCALTFISLLPYVVVRYLLGGVEWWHELACGMTVLGGAAMLSAGAIGASAFKTLPARFGVLILFIFSMLLGAGSALLGARMSSGGCGVIYHFTAFSAVICYVAVGIALARSRLRLAVMAYEVQPYGMMIGLMIFSPFVIGMVVAFTLGWGGALGLLGMALVALRLDRTPQAPASLKPPVANVPTIEHTKRSPLH